MPPAPFVLVRAAMTGRTVSFVVAFVVMTPPIIVSTVVARVVPAAVPIISVAVATLFDVAQRIEALVIQIDTTLPVSVRTAFAAVLLRDTETGAREWAWPAQLIGSRVGRRAERSGNHH